MPQDTVNPIVSPTEEPSGTANPKPHTHQVADIKNLRFDVDTGRVEPAYDAYNVKVNGQLVALYNAASTPGSFSAPTVPRVTVIQAIQNNEADEGNVLGREQADKYLAEGRISKTEYEDITKPTPKPTTEGVKPTAVVAGKDVGAVSGDITMELQLTPNGTTLGTMIKRVTFPRTIAQLASCHPSVSGPQAVVNNLAALALNVWEPIKKQYPNAFMTNSFRDGANIGGGQHGTGQACDLQFRGVKAHDYYDIAVWISKNIAYDQLLLEYTPGRTVWIHCSYAIPNLPYGGISVRKSRGVASTLATLNSTGGRGGFVVNLHEDILVSSVPNRVVAA